MSIDPAPPSDALLPEEHHIRCLMDSSLSLFQRYGSLFALRDRGTNSAVLGLCKALLEDTSSALLRHEIAFVLGQLQNKAWRNADGPRGGHSQMVRHEAAEAAGAVLDDVDRSKALLEEFVKDSNQVVAESCIVALDIADYWADDAQFQYADVA